ncbi:2-hydroxyacid dehydrogenase [Paracoccus aerodenitrificans]|uniref:2-hydroxyacid dehydrogenase n=1 Tax=Paracoccus aerodenitrificans TaxID=3017781 RepID=UPI0022F03895|nr:2-hydroxyacid dehydrogenase [Paracoccus aerodenitrificans]WBU63904.1 2-hydroxyacid dehydrogenase [Paracoccus aerodenitrificans]
MQRPQLLTMTTPPSRLLSGLEAEYRLIRWDVSDRSISFLKENAGECRAMLVNGNMRATVEMLAALPKLEVISCTTAGYDGLPADELARRGIALTNTSPALRDDVADMAILLMMAGRRSFLAADAYVRSGEWARHGMFPLQRSLKSSHLGIVGMGSLGSAVAERAGVFGMKIAYWNRRRKDVAWRFEPDLMQLARDSDVLMATVAGGPDTEGLISAGIMNALGPEGLLVNIARGPVVDEPALIAALNGGMLGHAALDVFMNEPSPDPALTSLPNVTLSPHHASGTYEAREAMAQLAVDNLAAFFAGKDLISPVRLHA